MFVVLYGDADSISCLLVAEQLSIGFSSASDGGILDIIMNKLAYMNGTHTRLGAA